MKAMHSTLRVKFLHRSLRTLQLSPCMGRIPGALNTLLEDLSSLMTQHL